MKTAKASLASALLLLGGLALASAQGSAFTYQGRLNAGGAPANGTFDFQFQLAQGASDPADPRTTRTNANVAVSNGLFTATLDFGPGIFTGADRWLEVAVRTNGGGAYTTLTPRQQLTPTPYAISSGNLSGALRVELNTNGGPNLIGGSPANQVDAGVQGATISGGGTLNYFGFPYTNRVSADFGAIGGGIANLAQSFGSFIGGGYGNTVEPGLGYYSAIVGGALNRIRADASDSFIAGGDGNVIGNGVSYASIGGGYLNTNASSYSVIAGGQYNTTEPFTDSSAIGGGWLNVIQSRADQSVIAGGNANGIQTGARESFIGGGFANTIQTNAAFSFIGAGTGNGIGSNSVWGTIAGGQQNSIQSNSPSATIGGGQNNLIQPYGQYGTIGGGVGNVAGFLSTVGGGQGNAISNAAFGTIAGGVANGIAYAVQYGTIGGGHLNQISQFAHGSTIAGGWSNSILFNVQISAIGGGFGNVIRTGGDYSSIGGGQFNTNGGYISLISGGQNNTIAPLADHSVIGGGGDNRIIGSLASAVYATISGGLANTVQSNAQYATIPGGASNSVAGNYGLAAGRRAKANHSGAFVWADSTDADFASTASNQFNVRATGGVRLETRGAGATIDGLQLLSGVVPSSSIAGGYSSAVTFNNPANSFTGNGGGLTNVNAATLGGLASSSFWKATGNAGTTPAANFLGTTDNQPLEIKVNNARALRLEPIVNNTVYSNLVNFVGGSSANYVTPFKVGATIAGGGGALYGTATNIPNRVLGDFGSIGGGVNNSCGFAATVAGGTANQASGDDSSVGGGFQNFAQAYAATVAGGTVNFGAGSRSTVGGGTEHQQRVIRHHPGRLPEHRLGIG